MFRVFRRAIAASGAALFALAVASVPCPAAAPGDTAGFAGDFSRFIAFVAGSPLSPAEQQRVSDETAAQLRTDAAGVRRGDAWVRDYLGKLAHDPPYAAADRREAFRLGFEMLPENDPGRRIVEAHDPTVVFDRAHKRLVTERSLAAWRDAFTYVAGLLNIPGPPEDFVATERVYVRANFASFSDDRQEALAHVERNYPVTRAILEKAEKSRLDAWEQQSRALALKLDPQARSLRLADMLRQTVDDALTHAEFEHNLLLGSAANYNMLYHAGYRSGIFR
jgi:hypothetical protein